MSRRFLKVIPLALLAAVIVLGTSAVRPAAGAGKDIPMKAVFSDGPFKVLGDSLGPYVHQGSRAGQNFLLIGGVDGNFAMVIYAATGRHVNFLFDTLLFPPASPNPGECGYPYFLDSPADPVETTYFFLKTVWKCKYIPHQEPDGTTWTEFIRSTTSKDATILNLTTMRPGETVGVSVEMMKFRVQDNLLTPGYDESSDMYGLTGYPTGAGYLLVTAGDWDGNGVMDWVLRTIPGMLVVKEHDRTTELPQGDCLKLGYWPCYWGSFGLPFELKIAKK